MEEENVCLCCFEKFDETRPAVIKHCGHTFHEECNRELLERTKFCPVCKTSPDGDQNDQYSLDINLYYSNIFERAKDALKNSITTGDFVSSQNIIWSAIRTFRDYNLKFVSHLLLMADLNHFHSKNIPAGFQSGPEEQRIYNERVNENREYILNRYGLNINEV